MRGLTKLTLFGVSQGATVSWGLRLSSSGSPRRVEAPTDYVISSDAVLGPVLPVADNVNESVRSSLEVDLNEASNMHARLLAAAAARNESDPKNIEKFREAIKRLRPDIGEIESESEPKIVEYLTWQVQSLLHNMGQYSSLEVDLNEAERLLRRWMFFSPLLGSAPDPKKIEEFRQEIEGLRRKIGDIKPESLPIVAENLTQQVQSLLDNLKQLLESLRSS